MSHTFCSVRRILGLETPSLSVGYSRAITPHCEAGVSFYYPEVKSTQTTLQPLGIGLELNFKDVLDSHLGI